MPQYNILLVDDEQEILNALKRNLHGCGYNVFTCLSGEEATKALNQREWDLVITDLTMGELNGISVLKKAKEINPAVMVIILTAHADLSSAINALRFDADDFMLKPWEPQKLRFRVDRCLEKLELSRKIRLYETILPVCCVCKKVRDDSDKGPGQGEWRSMEEYLKKRAGVDASHTYCPECHQRYKQKIESTIKRSSVLGSLDNMACGAKRGL